MPGEIKKILDLKKVKEFDRIQFEGTKIEDEITAGMNRVDSIKELMKLVSGKL